MTARDDDFETLWYSLALWSRSTFGNDEVRGPVGPLKHLLKEVNEAISAASEGEREELHVEIADCFMITLDAARRSGLTADGLLAQAWAKFAVNLEREWPDPMSATEPVEHVRP